MPINRSTCPGKSHFGFLLPVILFLALSGICNTSDAANDSESLSSTILYFEEAEPGIEPYRTRYIVNEQFLRIDDGDAEDDFILFDRRQSVIYSIAHKSRSILAIEDHADKALPELPENQHTLKFFHREREDANLPEVAGHKVFAYQLYVSETVCSEFSAASGLLPEVVSMFKDYEKLLAKNNRKNLANQPAEYISDCMLVNDILAAGHFLSFGFPVVLQKPNGVRRFLLDFQESVPIEKSLFTIPVQYRFLDFSKSARL